MASMKMNSPLGKVPRPRLYEQLVQQILGYVDAEQLGPGDRLPAERDLAERLGVSRATLSQALVALEVLGVIEVQHGNGALLVYRPTLARVIRQLREHEKRLPDITEARSTLEVKLASLAAVRRSDKDLEQIQEALRFMAEEIESGERGARGDEMFHQAITHAARSSVLQQLMAFIAEMVLETRIESLSQPGRPEQSLASHRKIFDAIKKGDPVAAGEAMQDHIDLVSDVALLKES